MKNCGGYTRIFPDSEDPLKYNTFLETSNKQWEIFYGGKNIRHSIAVSESQTISSQLRKKKPVMPLRNVIVTHTHDCERKLLHAESSVKKTIALTHKTEYATDIATRKSPIFPSSYLPIISKPPPIQPREVYCTRQERRTDSHYGRMDRAVVPLSNIGL